MQNLRPKSNAKCNNILAAVFNLKIHIGIVETAEHLRFA